MIKLLKVLMISARADHGGGPMCLYNIVRGLETDSVRFFAAIPNQEPYWDALSAMLGQHRLTTIPYRRFSVRAFISLLLYVKCNRIDVVHSHGKGAGVYSRLLGLFARVKVVHTFHGIHHETYHSQAARWSYLLVEAVMTKYMTDAAICVSASEMKTAQSLNLLGKKTCIVANGVEVRPNNGILGSLTPPRNHRICTITRFDAEGAKGADIFVRVVQSLSKRYPDVEAIVIGGGEEKDSLLDLIRKLEVEKHIKLLGFQKNPRDYLIGGEVFVSTSRREGLPLSVLEAMAQQCPVVVTAVRGNVDAVRDGIDGLWAQSEDPEDVALKVARLFEDGALRQLLARTAYLRARECFSIETMCEKTRKVYWDVLARAVCP